MKSLKYILASVCGLALLIFITGLCLPERRVTTQQIEIAASPDAVFNIVTDNNNWQYRSDIKDLRITTSREGMKEQWDEISSGGRSVHFKVREKMPHGLYSFDIYGKLFNGFRTNEFAYCGDGGTLFTTTQSIRMKNIFLRPFSYIFLSPGKQLERYMDDVKKRAEEVNANL